MSKSLYFVSFVAGAAAGAVASWLFAKKKYEQLAQEEIRVAREVFANKKPVDEKTVDIPTEKPKEVKKHSGRYPWGSEENLEKTKAVDNIVQNLGYSKEIEEKVLKTEKPYVISPEEFGEMHGYETISLNYYADHILTDDLDELVEDVENWVGFESLNHFGEYEADSVFVRNDRLKCDFEILLDLRNYSDVLKSKPHPREELHDE